MTKCTAPKHGHKRGSAALLSCPSCGPRGGVVVRAGAVTPAAGGELGLDAKDALARTSKDPDVLVALAGDKDSDVRWRVALNPNTPVAALEALAEDKDYGVRWGVAQHPNTPAAALEVLARDRESGARGMVALSPNAPAAALEALARDRSHGVRQKVAENPNTPAATFEVLAGDENSGVRRSVATNPSAPISSLAELMGDPVPYIAAAARNRFTSWAQETLDLGSAPTEQLIDMLITLKAWELDPKDPAVTAAIVLCN